MRAVIQRVSYASVKADGVPRGSIGKGLFVLLGIAPDDKPEYARFLAEKIVKMSIFTDEDGRMAL